MNIRDASIALTISICLVAIPFYLIIYKGQGSRHTSVTTELGVEAKPEVYVRCFFHNGDVQEWFGNNLWQGTDGSFGFTEHGTTNRLNIKNASCTILTEEG